MSVRGGAVDMSVMVMLHFTPQMMKQHALVKSKSDDEISADAGRSSHLLYISQIRGFKPETGGLL